MPDRTSQARHKNPHALQRAAPVPQSHCRAGSAGRGARTYDGMLTSGEAGFIIACRAASFSSANANPPISYIGPAKDADVLHGLPHPPEHRKKRISCSTSASAMTRTAWTNGTMYWTVAAARKLPMLCLNPDMEVVKLSGERFPCAGMIALAYEALGGGEIHRQAVSGSICHGAGKMLGVPKERVLVAGLFLVVWATDTGALIAGNLIGGRKLAPVLSPNKTSAGFPAASSRRQLSKLSLSTSSAETSFLRPYLEARSPFVRIWAIC